MYIHQSNHKQHKHITNNNKPNNNGTYIYKCIHGAKVITNNTLKTTQLTQKKQIKHGTYTNTNKKEQQTHIKQIKNQRQQTKQTKDGISISEYMNSEHKHKQRKQIPNNNKTTLPKLVHI